MRKYFSIDNVMKIVMVGVMILIILCSVIVDSSCMEGDSYMLPIESLQHRGSIVITQEDIDYARDDMPYFYGNVYTYNDLRSAKLCQIDENHWLAWYFPLYAMLCLPMKLVLQLAGLDQHYAFTFTNGLMCALAFYLLYYYALKKKEKILLSHYIDDFKSYMGLLALCRCRTCNVFSIDYCNAVLERKEI